jgi:hypothetical protein
VREEKYSEAQLSEAFDLVADAEDWKLPICKIVPAGADRDLIYDAVSYYTGGGAFFSEQDDGTWLVTGDGYYLNMVH